MTDLTPFVYVWHWLNGTPAGKAVKTYALAWAAVVLACWLATGCDFGALTAENLAEWASYGLATAVVPVAINAWNPADPRYGKGAPKPPEGGAE